MRAEGWERRMWCVIDEARTKPYQLGVHDCFSFACAVVQEITGVNRFIDWKGRYSTKREALKLIADFGGDFSDAMSHVFGTRPCAAYLAKRGDVLEYRDAGGESHLAVCCGVQAAALGENGLLFIKTLDCERCWRID